MKSRLSYLNRIISAYLLSSKSNLCFWHTDLAVNNIKDVTNLGRYYMNFIAKTAFQGPFDVNGIPMLDYKGNVGVQYNPNAVAQYGLGFYDLFVDTGNPEYKRRFLKQADWFLRSIRFVEGDVGLWEYNFDFEYHTGLKAPWKSALAQGQGISVLVRAYALTQNNDYLHTASKAFNSFLHDISEPGGVTYIDENGYTWFEELIFNPPTHVLNGFIWALWGVYDYYLLSKDPDSMRLFNEGVRTLEDHLPRYDIGFWTTYHLLPTRLKVIASTYYQRLHIVQLEVMFSLTGKNIFKKYADIWRVYYSKWHYKCLAMSWKAFSKLLYY